MNIRKVVDLPVTIYFPDKGGHGSFDAVVRDLGFGGAFIEAGRTMLPKGSIVRLALGTSLQQPVTIDALILRSEAGGAGVMFAYYGDDIFRQLAAMLEPAADRHYAHEPH